MNITRLIFLVLLPLSASINYSAIGQSNIIEFNQQPLRLTNNRLYLNKVIDHRAQQTCLGKVFEVNPDSTKCLEIKPSLEEAIYNYLAPQMTEDNLNIPVELEILNLSMNDLEIKSNKHRVTTIQLAVYHMEDSVHEKIFQGIIQQDNLTDLNNTDYAGEIQELLKSTILKINRDKEVKQYIEKAIPLLSHTVHHRITFTSAIGLDANSYNLQYYRYKINPLKDWVRPFGFALGIFSSRDRHTKVLLDEESKITFVSPGVTLFKKLSNYWWLNLKNQVPLGIEKVVIGNETNKNFVFGVSFSQIIMLIPTEKFGASFGIGTYQRLLKSKVYPWDLGLILEFGFKF